MYFLDIVFPLQYPMYKPKVSEGGRGWLLSLLLSAIPVHHAALTLSSYHRRMTTAEILSPALRATALVDQEKHLEIAIKSVNQFAQGSCPYDGLDVIMAIVQLMFFEVPTSLSI
jgi:hypothetical protein